MHYQQTWNSLYEVRSTAFKLMNISGILSNVYLNRPTPQVSFWVYSTKNDLYYFFTTSLTLCLCACVCGWGEVEAGGGRERRSCFDRHKNIGSALINWPREWKSLRHSKRSPRWLALGRITSDESVWGGWGRKGGLQGVKNRILPVQFRYCSR